MYVNILLFELLQFLKSTQQQYSDEKNKKNNYNNI